MFCAVNLSTITCIVTIVCMVPIPPLTNNRFLWVCNGYESCYIFLYSKSSRVTVKIEVSFTEHSHVIGKGGNNIRSVMQDTGCHIHFPDSNRNNQVEKSNQVGGFQVFSRSLSECVQGYASSHA